MNLQKFYESINGDYATVLSRQKTESRIKKFLSLIKSDTSYDELKSAIENQDHAAACKNINSLKSLALNLSLDPLQNSVEELEKNLKRGEKNQDTDGLFKFVTQDYQKILESLEQLEMEE